MPSPPKFDPNSFILFTTFISPTADLSTELPFVSASSSIASDVDKFTTSFSVFSISSKYPSAAITNVYSSPKGMPFSSTKAKRSASGSIANPASALCFFTALHKSTKLVGNGSVPRINSPLGSQKRGITSQPKESSN